MIPIIGVDWKLTFIRYETLSRIVLNLQLNYAN